jgi:hypothetical protein
MTGFGTIPACWDVRALVADVRAGAKRRVGMAEQGGLGVQDPAAQDALEFLWIAMAWDWISKPKSTPRRAGHRASADEGMINFSTAIPKK